MLEVKKADNFQPQTFTAKFLYKGVAVYKNEKVLIDKHIDDIANSFVGIGVVIGHIDDDLKKDDSRKVGEVTRVFLNKDGFTTTEGKFIPADCDYYCDFTLNNQTAVNSWKNIGFVSSAYSVLETEPGGTYINNAYDVEIKKIKPEHMAIVSEPRYEQAKILKNSKQNQIMSEIKENEIKSESALSTALNKALDIIGLKIANSKTSKKNEETYDQEEEQDEAKKKNAKMKKNDEDEDGMALNEEEKDFVKNALEKFRNKKKKNSEADDEDKKENEKDEADEKEEKKENGKMKKNSVDPLEDARNSFAEEKTEKSYINGFRIGREMFEKPTN